MPSLSHGPLSMTNVALSVTTSIVQLCKPRPPSRTFLGGKLSQRRSEGRRMGLWAPLSFLRGPQVGSVASLAPGLDELVLFWTPALPWLLLIPSHPIHDQ